MTFANDILDRVREAVGIDPDGGRTLVVAAMSGGVDSTVAAVLIHKAIGKNLTCIFVDNGLLAALQGISLDKLQTDRRLLGPMLETFVLTELLKLASWSGDRLEFSHYRDKEKNEVDIIIRNRGGFVVGIEVKASATVTTADFKGLKKLAAACKSRFSIGLVLYDHDKIIPFGDRLYAAPVSALWH